jgi:hypothetical protein
MDDYMRWLSAGGMPLLNQTWNATEERVEGDFEGLVRTAYQSNGVVFACLMTRFLLFSEARFQFQQMRAGRPGDLFGTPALQVLEEPEPGVTTAGMLKLARLDADLSGDWFGVRRPGRIKRLRPDWTMIMVGSPNPATDYPGHDPDAEIAGYGYSPLNRYANGEVWTFGPNEVAHYVGAPDPLARYRGMPLPTAALRDIAGDGAATAHKRKFFELAATPNLVVKFPATLDPKKAQNLIDVFEQDHVGVNNAYRTMYLLGGAEIEAVGKDLQQLEFKATQGAGETRIAAALNVRPEIAGLSEGLQGSSLNAGNMTQVRRLQADKQLRPDWRDFAGSLQTIIPPLPGTRLWYDDRDIPFLREDIKDAADVLVKQAQAIRSLSDGGWEPDAVVDAVTANDLRRLASQHTGMLSVQLQAPGTVPGSAPDGIALAARSDFTATSGAWEGISVERGQLVSANHPLAARFPSLFEPIENVDGRHVAEWRPTTMLAPTALVASTNGGH